MLPGLRIVKRLEQQNKKNKLQCSLANWLFLAEASKNQEADSPQKSKQKSESGATNGSPKKAGLITTSIVSVFLFIL